MLVVTIILGHLAVLVVGQRQLIVLSAVDHALLDRSVDLAEAHGGSSSAEGIDHSHAGRALLHADLFAL